MVLWGGGNHLIHDRSKRFLFSPQHPDQLGGPPECLLGAPNAGVDKSRGVLPHPHMTFMTYLSTTVSLPECDCYSKKYVGPWR